MGQKIRRNELDLYINRKRRKIETEIERDLCKTWRFLLTKRYIAMNYQNVTRFVKR